VETLGIRKMLITLVMGIMGLMGIGCKMYQVFISTMLSQESNNKVIVRQIIKIKKSLQWTLLVRLKVLYFKNYILNIINSKYFQKIHFITSISPTSNL
jgi:hypothetical protein